MYHFGLNVGDSDDDLRAMLTTLHEAGATIVGGVGPHGDHSLASKTPTATKSSSYVDVRGVDWKADPALITAPIRPLKL